MFRRRLTALTLPLLAAALLTPALVSFAADDPAPKGTAAAAKAFRSQVDAHFAGWDKNHDGDLSLIEIDTALSDAKCTGPEAAAVAAIKMAGKNKKGIVLPAPLTAEALRGLVAPPSSPDAPSLNVPSLYARALTRIKRSGGSQAALFSSAGPRLEDVHQGRLGDCYCLAPLGAMLYRDPATVTNLFHKRADGTYEIKLGLQSVTVAPPTDGELAIGATSGQGTMWINLYEKAIGGVRIARAAAAGVPQPTLTTVAATTTAPATTGEAGAAAGTTPATKAAPALKTGSTQLDAVDHGGSSGMVMAALTGHRIIRFSCRFAQDDKTKPERREELMKQLRERLTAAFEAKRLVTCGTNKPTTPGITPNHAYAILGYDAAADTLRLWNPHGQKFTPKGASGLTTGYPTEGGLFTIPLTDFVNQFTGVSIETDEETPAPAAP